MRDWWKTVTVLRRAVRPGLRGRRLLALLVVLVMVLGACGDDDDTSAGADEVDTADASGGGADTPPDDGVPGDPCDPFLELDSIAAAYEGTVDDEAGAEATRQRILVDLGEAAGDDAPPGIVDAIDVLARLHPIGGAPSIEDQRQIEVANQSIYDYFGPVCGLGDSVGSEIGPVTIGGVGEVSIGMPSDDAAAIIGFDASDPDFQEFESQGCAVMLPARGLGYDGLEFMVFDGIVQRIDVRFGAWFTPSGIGLGASAEDLVAAYGAALETSPSKYDENGTYVEFVPSDPGNDGLRLLFETSDGVVMTFRVGFTEPVRFVEGCS